MRKSKWYYLVRGSVVLAMCPSVAAAEKLQRSLEPGTEIVDIRPQVTQ